MKLTAAHLRSIAGPKASKKNTEGAIASLDWLGRFNISPPHRLAHFIAQIAHESDRFRTTSEYASGAAYEGRSDLGNTKPGDGKRFKGHGLIQTTGRYNHGEFTTWVRGYIPDAPDFVRYPQKLTEFPWAMLSAVWYWETRNLSRYADANNIEMITRRINGGLNGYSDRVNLYTRTALVLLGYKMESGVIGQFQRDNGLKVDDIAGPATRAELHERLKALPLASKPKPPAPPASPPDIPAPKPAPVPPVKSPWPNRIVGVVIVAAIVAVGTKIAGLW